MQSRIIFNFKICRLRFRNEELEAKVEIIKKRLNELEENKADLNSHLQQVLKKKTEEAQELHERLAALEKIHYQEHRDFKKKEELLENEFRVMEHNLIAEVKLAGKIIIDGEIEKMNSLLTNKFYFYGFLYYFV
jgi:predicted nuclease with TOPRIM domain